MSWLGTHVLNQYCTPNDLCQLTIVVLQVWQAQESSCSELLLWWGYVWQWRATSQYLSLVSIDYYNNNYNYFYPCITKYSLENTSSKNQL